MAMKLPAQYTAAKKALAAAVNIPEFKHIRDVAAGLEVYAMQAKDGTLAGDAAEIKVLATRKIGEVIEARRKAGKLAKGGAQKGVGRRGMRVADKPALSAKALAAEGVDKNLAHRARKLAAMSGSAFEAEVRKVRRLAAAAAMGDREVVLSAKADRHAASRARRDQREQELAGKIVALPQKKFGVIYADPEWKFETYSEDGKLETSAENHYPTSELRAIRDRKVETIAAKDAVLWLWATVPMLPQALEVMEAWGFEYKSHVIWNKDRTGTGYWFLNKHELLLVGTRGSIPAPAQGTQWPSVVDAPRGRHSEKPEVFYELIEAYFPNLPKIELNARKARKGWASWGLEAPVADAAE